ncbi:dihydrofolate reductase family protein [Salirhabdus sp. Marseille-P4669]|uniref:dihydrofolate reductase family protein n=1 Tax=Salirhabdus sp. Marseille-P4669 TaxID=2042310 RepID=UPI000C7D33A9|nr:dihydrofolate reductase family protein [Salirhabdus sp. Marseille-P4669]
MNKRNVIVYIAMSLDGYIATKDDNLDWLFAVEGEGDNGISDFYHTVDTVLLGKRTYDWIMDQEENFPYKDRECYVFTKSHMQDTEDVTIVNGDLIAFTNELKAKDGRDIWLVGGGEIIHHFLKADLVDQLRITIAPTLIGDGIPLFKPGYPQLEFELTGTKQFNQFIELQYVRKK